METVTDQLLESPCCAQTANDAHPYDIDIDIATGQFDAERLVGITEFLNRDSLGFTGILKHRFADFRVSEIGLDGQVASLSDKLCDEALQKIKESDGEGIILDEESVTLKQIQKILGSVIPDLCLLQSILDLAVHADQKELLTPVIAEKNNRTIVHQGIRVLFRGLLQTESSGDQIRIYHRSCSSVQRRGRDDRNSRPPGQHKYLQFTLQKENLDTIDAIQLIAKRLHMSAKDFTYAGTKDRRGITCQTIVARNVTAAKILGINKFSENNRIKISDIRIAKGPLKLGDLLGNRFELIIRNIEGVKAELVEQMVETFAKNGFINYFGLQRFGTTSVPSYRIGLALLKGNYSEAVDLILSPRNEESDERAVAARKHWKDTSDAETSRQMFPHRYIAERQILAHFARDPTNANDYLGAILSINRELRLMYVHSVQSLIWNRLASARFGRYGCGLLEGDLIILDSSKEPIIMTGKEDMKSLLKENLVLAIPGYQSLLPSNEMAAMYKQELSHLGIADVTTAFKPKNKALWDLPGAYRHVFVTPKNLQYQIGYYSDPDADLPTDFSSKGSFLGLSISFDLPSSCYATMALRELMQSGTDPRHHKVQTKRHRTQ